MLCPPWLVSEGLLLYLRDSSFLRRGGPKSTPRFSDQQAWAGCEDGLGRAHLLRWVGSPSGSKGGQEDSWEATGPVPPGGRPCSPFSWLDNEAPAKGVHLMRKRSSVKGPAGPMHGAVTPGRGHRGWCQVPEVGLSWASGWRERITDLLTAGLHTRPH